MKIFYIGKLMNDKFDDVRSKDPSAPPVGFFDQSHALDGESQFNQLISRAMYSSQTDFKIVESGPEGSGCQTNCSLTSDDGRMTVFLAHKAIKENNIVNAFIIITDEPLSIDACKDLQESVYKFEEPLSKLLRDGEIILPKVLPSFWPCPVM